MAHVPHYCCCVRSSRCSHRPHTLDTTWGKEDRSAYNEYAKTLRPPSLPLSCHRTIHTTQSVVCHADRVIVPNKSLSTSSRGRETHFHEAGGERVFVFLCGKINQFRFLSRPHLHGLHQTNAKHTRASTRAHRTLTHYAIMPHATFSQGGPVCNMICWQVCMGFPALVLLLLLGVFV